MNAEQLNKEVMQIIGSGSYPRFKLRLVFSLGSSTLTAQSVLSKSTTANFASDFTEEISIRVMMITSDYNKLYAIRDNIVVTLIQEQVDPVSEVLIKNGISYQQKYRAFLTDNAPGETGSAQGVASIPYTDGSDELRGFSLQLVDPIALSMSAKNAQAIFRFSTVENALKTFIVSAADEDAAKGLTKLNGIEMVPPDVTDTRDQIVVDNHIKMKQLPNYLQHSEGGIYNHDIGSFIQNGFWYIYPLYNTRRFTSSERRATLYITSSLKIPTADVTVKKIGESLRIVCTGGCRSQDLSVSGDITLGLGTRYTKATEFFDNQGIIKDNQVTYNREAVSADVNFTGPRADGNSFAFTSNNAITDNIAREQSRVASRNGIILTTVWQRSEAKLLSPGMPVRVYRDTGNGVVLMEGVLLQVTENWTLERPGMIQTLQTTAAGLVLYLEKV